MKTTKAFIATDAAKELRYNGATSLYACSYGSSHTVEALVIPLAAKPVEALKEKVARAIHAEHNRHEGITTPWASLHKFQREKYRGKAYAALVAIGAYIAT